MASVMAMIAPKATIVYQTQPLIQRNTPGGCSEMLMLLPPSLESWARGRARLKEME